MFRNCIVVFVLLFSVTSNALEPAEDFGIKLIPPFMAEKTVSECEYLGEVASRSMWGGLVAGSLGNKGVMKRMYKKAHKLGASHMVLITGSDTVWSGFTKGSAHAFKCAGGIDVGGYTAIEAVDLAAKRESAEEAASSQTQVNLRAVRPPKSGSCQFIKSITKGKGGAGDPSKYMEEALQSALVEAANLGADSYEIVNMDTTATGASISIDALNCST